MRAQGIIAVTAGNEPERHAGKDLLWAGAVRMK